MTHLKVGEQAPFFLGINQDGQERSLLHYNDKKLIVFFYPKDNTPGCTSESCNLSNNYNILSEHGFEVLGVSADSEISHRKFIDKYNLCFDLIADTDKAICNDYGVFGKKKFMGKEYLGIHRTTFIINQNQTIEKIFTKVETKNHAEQILASYK